MKPSVQIEHARIVAHYIVSTGRVGHRDFLDALSKAEAQYEAGSLSWASPEMLELRDRYATSLNAIAPVRLHHLIEGKDDDRNRYAPPFRSSRWVNVSLIAITLLLLAAIVGLTDLHSRGNHVLAAREAGYEMQQRLLVSQMVPLVVQIEDAEQTGGNETVARTALLDRIHALQDLSSRIVEVRREQGRVEAELQPIIAGFDVVASPFQTASATGHWLGTTLIGSANAATGQPEAGTEPETGTGTGTGTGTTVPEAPLVAQEKSDALLNGHMLVADRCEQLVDKELILTGTTTRGGNEMLPFGLSVSREIDTQAYLHCVLELDQLEGAVQSPPDAREGNQDDSTGLEATPFPDSRDADEVVRGLALLGGAVLPFLYGALGAAVYHLRRCLDPNEPNPPFSRAVMRIVLAGFAGVTVAWFWQPDAQGLVQIGSLPVSSFVIAFVFGYGIDAFFTMLDRLVSLTTTSALRLGDKQS